MRRSPHEVVTLLLPLKLEESCRQVQFSSSKPWFDNTALLPDNGSYAIDTPVDDIAERLYEIRDLSNVKRDLYKERS